ncbi:MAG: PDZ domain-containing protein [Phycisphaerae bacterium]
MIARAWHGRGFLGLAAALAAINFGLVHTAPAWAQATPELSPDEVEKADRLRQDLRQMVTIARDRVFPALVNIKVITVRYWDGKEQKGQAVGSGTIISPDGYVLTNFHVAENGKKFKCTLADKQEIAATLVGEDPLTDLAVLKLDLSELKDANAKLPYATFGDSDTLQIGDPVMAMGSPWALSRSVTYGIVNNTERMLGGGEDEAEEMRFDRDQRTGIFNRWIQHDAAINPGNSGGPLVNLKGELVGVNTRGSIIGGDMGFAIPSNVAKSVAQALMTHGEVPRSWYGMSLKSIKKSGLEKGVLVNSVDVDSPIAKAGIKAGDVITAIDGKPVTVKFAEEIPPLLKEMADRKIGGEVKITYERDGKLTDTTVTTVKMQKDRGEEAAFRGWGMTAMEITERMAFQRRLDSTDGVLISSVRSGNPAAMAEPALNDGDVIRVLNGKPIKTLDDFVKEYESIMEAETKPEHVLIEFDRWGKNNVTLIKPRPDKEDDPPREVAKAWVGVATQVVNEKLAKQLGKPDVRGFRVTRVYPKTLAAGTDLKVGDIITMLNDEKLTPKESTDSGMFDRMVRKLTIDQEAELTVLRGDQSQAVKVKLERSRLKPEEARRDVNRDFELTVREMTFFDRDDNRWDDTVKGVLVVGTESAGWASLGGLRGGDLIQRIGEYTITDLKTYREAMEKLTKDQPERVVFVVLRGVSTHFQYIEPEWKVTTTEDAKDAKDEKKDAPAGEKKEPK